MTDLQAQLQATLGATYSIQRELGGGGMSRVFVARDETLGREIVIKVIAPENAEGINAERFAREVKLAARLQQANIVPVLTAGTSGTLPYYTMPFVRGESLRARLATGAELGVAESVSIMRDVARALAYAHAEGVVHRDIKPENVLLSGGAAVVTDFGIAKAMVASRTQDGGATAGLTMAGASLGTPAYMAPEQALGDPGADHRVDIYAWGVVAWELLGGAHPFAGRTTVQALVKAHVTEAPGSLSSQRPGVPEALGALVMRCLEKNPANRPQSASELLAAVESINTSGETVTRAPRVSKRSRSMLLTGATILLAIAVAFMVMRRGGTAPVTVRDKSLAVLPFTASGGDTANSYLAEGIAAEVSNSLAQLPGLRLAGRSSSARMAGKSVSVQEVGKALNVGSVLDGTVRRVGDQIRVTAELSDVRDGAVVWHQSYERAARDAFAVQDEIARAIAGQLQVTLFGAGMAARGTSDAAAYDLYLRGMYLYRRRGPAIVEAISTLEQATVRDTAFARAWAGLSNALTASQSYLNTRPADLLVRARAAAEHAVRLDSALSVAHLALGYVDAEQFQWKAAELELQRALSLDRNNAEANYRLGFILMNQGDLDHAIPEFRRAQAKDPLFFLPAAYLGWAEANARRFPEGVADVRRSLALEPDVITSLVVAASVYTRAGLRDSALRYARLILHTSTQPAPIGVAAYALARNGDRKGAQLLIRQLEATPTSAWTRWTALALAYAGLGDSVRTIAAMENAAKGEGDGFPVFAPVADFPTGPRTDAVWRRYNIDPARFRRRYGN